MGVYRSHRRTTRWNFFFQYIYIALAMLSGLVLVPLYLHFIPLNLYGAWLATGNILTWLTVIDPGLSTVLQQRVGVAYGRGDVAELNSLLTGGVILSGAISLLVLVAGLVSARFLIGWLNLGTTTDTALVERAFLIAVVGSASMIFFYGLSAFSLGLQSSLGAGLIFSIITFLSMLLTVLLLFKGLGLLSLPIGMVVRGVGSTLGYSGYLIWRYKREKLPYHFSLSGVAKLLKLTAYTFLGRGAGVIATNMDAFVLTRYLGAEIAPVFLLTRGAPDMSRMFLERPAVAFTPAVSHLVGSGELERARTVLLRLLRMILWLLGMITAGFIIFNKDFVALWVGPKLFAGQTVNLIIALTLAVTVLVNALSNLCFSLGNIKSNSLAALAQGLLTVPLIIVGARYWGMLGVAVAPLLAMLTVSAWYYPYAFSRLLTLKRADVLAFVNEAVAVMGAATIAMGVMFWVEAKTWLIFVLAVAAFSAIYLAFLWGISQAFRVEVKTVLRSDWVPRIFSRRAKIGL